ncbi:50S ribosomal protein L24, partial [Thermodesulfobacteriota bacterium]
MAHLKRDDNVVVISGKEAGKRGKILKINDEKKTAVVERVNFVKRHTKAGGTAGQQGGIIEKEAPLKL